VAAALALVLALLVLRAPAAAQELPTSTSEAPRPSLTTTSIVQDGDGGDDGLSTGNKVLLVVVGLVVFALLLAFFTWRYWRATKPAAEPSAVPEGVAPAPARRSAPTV
jgi:hypothetical protein